MESFFKRIVFLFPTELEFLPVCRILKAKPIDNNQKRYRLTDNKKEYLFVQTGIGKKRSIALVKEVIERFTPDCIVSCGCCGGLKTYLMAGTLLLPAKIYSGGGETYTIEQTPLTQRLGLLLRDALFSSRKPLGTERKKEVAAQFPDAEGVDMESFWVLKSAAQFNIPAFAMRAVVDRLHDRIPIIGKSFLWYLFRPTQLLAKYKFARGCKKANRTIAKKIAEMMDKLD